MVPLLLTVTFINRQIPSHIFRTRSTLVLIVQIINEPGCRGSDALFDSTNLIHKKKNGIPGQIRYFTKSNVTSVEGLCKLTLSAFHGFKNIWQVSHLSCPEDYYTAPVDEQASHPSQEI
jgi:hypothetical protein